MDHFTPVHFIKSQWMLYFSQTGFRPLILLVLLYKRDVMCRTFTYFDTAILVLVLPLPCSLNKMTHHHFKDGLECGLALYHTWQLTYSVAALMALHNSAKENLAY